MKKTSAISLLAILSTMALFPALTFPASAASSCAVTSANPPAGWSQVVNVRQPVVNDVDSGTTALWALDAFTVTVQVWQSGANYYAFGLYSGTSYIPAGAPSPGAGAPEKYSDTAQMSGGFISTFSGTYSLPSQTTGTLPAINANGTVAEVLSNTYPPRSPLAGLLRLGALGSAIFNAMGPWGWQYSYGSQSWCDSVSGIYGDIITQAPPPPSHQNPIPSNYIQTVGISIAGARVQSHLVQTLGPYEAEFNIPKGFNGTTLTEAFLSGNATKIAAAFASLPSVVNRCIEPSGSMKVSGLFEMSWGGNLNSSEVIFSGYDSFATSPAGWPSSPACSA